MLKIFKKSTDKSSQSGSDTLDQVINLIREIDEEYQGIELKAETKFEDLAFDSIKFMNLILNLEDIIDREIEEVVEHIDLASIVTIQDIVVIVQGLKGTK